MSLANAMKQPLSPRGAERQVTLLRLVDRAETSTRLREILQGLLGLSATALELRVSETLGEFEKQLVRLADKATIHQQNHYFDSVHELKRGRADVVPRFMASLENALVRLGCDSAATLVACDADAPKVQLALTDGTHLDESLVLSDIATKVELRVREPLYALGHRYGALAGTPRLGAETMPLGPRSVAEAMRYAASGLDLPLEHRLVLYRCFERVVMNGIGSFYVALNNFLVEQGILRHLHQLPTSPERTSARDTPPELRSVAPTPMQSRLVATGEASTAGPRLVAVPARAETGKADAFGALRQLLSECRRAEAYIVAAEDLQAVLAALQSRQAAARADSNTLNVRAGEPLKHEILAILHERSGDGRAPRIAEEDCDTIDLVAMLFEFLARRARPNGLAHWVLAKLQIPVLRAALRDKGFFADAAHPARRLLNDLVEIGRFWIDEIETEKDLALVEKLQRIVDRIAFEYQGEGLVFIAALDELSHHVDALAQRATVTERRLVEAAAGREKLERSRLLAAAAIAERVACGKPNEFLRTLLERGWTDVLTLTLLREGGESTAYAQRLDVVDRLVSMHVQDNAETSLQLRADVEVGLAQVGLHEEDVRAITRRLFAHPDEQEENPISQTELAIKLKLKPRVGGEKSLPAPVVSELPLQPSEQAEFDRLHTLPHGTWFEFDINGQGDTLRRKLSWYSTQTGRCLFVNQRGVPHEELTMRDLAREIAAGRARKTDAQQQPLVGRAWQAICDTLENFSGRKTGERIEFTAPAARPSSNQAARAASSDEQAQAQRTLLLVDDEVNIQRALMRVLRNEGYRVLCATSAEEGMALLEQNDLQVIISDQRMPGVSGTEFLKNVKATHPDTVRILLSGFSDAAAVTDAINRGAIYKFLTKPWDDEDIREQIRDAFRACEVH